MIARLFVNPMLISWGACLYLVIPLCVVVSVVYKTVRVRYLSDLPKAAGLLVVYMLVGLVGLGAGLWVIWEVFH